MNLRTKTTLLTVFLLGSLLVCVVIVSLFFFRQFFLEMAQDHVRSIAEVVRVSLTESMINGTIEHRQQFLQRLAEIQGFDNARVVRGPEVNRQFGTDTTDLIAADDIESRVFTTGISSFSILQDLNKPLFRGTIAFIAHDRGTPNCLSCHHVPSNTVLGVITVHLSMKQLKHKAIITTSILITLIIGFGTMFTYLFRWQFSKVVKTAQGVERVVSLAKDGNFSGRLNHHGKDEVGRIAENLNSLMARLQRDLGAISHDIAHLMRYELQGNTNLLTTTTEMVDILLDVAQFKQAVEEDGSVLDVYDRIRQVLREQFWIKNLVIFEIMPNALHLRLVLPSSAKETTPPIHHECHLPTPGRVSSCRAQRTANVVDSFQDRSICPQFIRSPETETMEHICIPTLHSGTTGNIFQITVENKDSQLYLLLLPFIKIYLRESASMVEAKRLLDISRESALRDALTGLHNRRFLEEYIATLESTTLRQKTQLAVLLLDLDHFKRVNDTWGHDAGDTVLKSLAKVLTLQVVRTSDLMIRYGGEEFLVILQENEAAFGATMADRIRLAVENLPILVGETILHQTVSIGVAKFPSDGETIWNVIKSADQALYQAKAKGRNQVVVYASRPQD